MATPNNRASMAAGSGTPMESMKPRTQTPRGPKAIRAATILLNNSLFYRGWPSQWLPAGFSHHVGEGFTKLVKPRVAENEDHCRHQPQLPQRSEGGRLAVEEDGAVAVDQNVDRAL